MFAFLEVGTITVCLKSSGIIFTHVLPFGFKQMCFEVVALSASKVILSVPPDCLFTCILIVLQGVQEDMLSSPQFYLSNDPPPSLGKGKECLVQSCLEKSWLHWDMALVLFQRGAVSVCNRRAGFKSSSTLEYNQILGI